MAPRSCQSLPPVMRFVVHEDTESVRHLPLPALRPEFRALSRVELLKTIEEETSGGATTSEWCLPATVIFRSFIDPTYRARLTEDSDTVLRSDGFGTDGVSIKVHENSLDTHHLALPVNPWKGQVMSYEALYERYVARMLAP